MKNISRVLTALGLSFVFTLALSQPVWAENNNADLPTEKTLKSELAEAQKLPDGDEKTNNVTTIQASLDFLDKFKHSKKIITICKIRLLMQILKFRRIMPIFKILKNS